MATNRWRTVSTFPSGERPDCWSWLAEQGSLTERVRKLDSVEPFHLDVLYEARERLNADDAQLLGLAAGDPAIIREVSLNRGSTPMIFARSVMPSCSTNGSNSWLARLGDRPLGDALLDKEDVERSEFEVVLLDEGCLLHNRILLTIGRPGNPVWARRSRVAINRQPILINECFLSIPTS